MVFCQDNFQNRYFKSWKIFVNGHPIQPSIFRNVFWQRFSLRNIAMYSCDNSILLNFQIKIDFLPSRFKQNDSRQIPVLMIIPHKCAIWYSTDVTVCPWSPLCFVDVIWRVKCLQNSLHHLFCNPDNYSPADPLLSTFGSQKAEPHYTTSQMQYCTLVLDGGVLHPTTLGGVPWESPRRTNFAKLSICLRIGSYGVCTPGDSQERFELTWVRMKQLKMDFKWYLTSCACSVI